MTQDISMTQSLLERYYEEEKARQERELSLASLHVRLDASDLAMLGGIAKRFQKSRDELAGELLSTALLDLFARLEAGERKLMARDADEAARLLADEIAEENGVHSIEFKSGVWANHERQITKEERKRAKQQGDSKKASSQPQPQKAETSEQQAPSEPQEAAAAPAVAEEPSTAANGSSESVFAS